MGLHPSLKRANALGGSRSVMNRTERIKWLIEKGKWNQGDPVLGLPKIKIVKLKALKKEKQKPEEEGQPADASKTSQNKPE
ncbi:MAG: small basic protein [Candidatus Omnitrophica bacterium]|nr:small basic protein [Candidatus Omnitrophota bacterium]MBU2044476.1 small basic protein [Candidatus Omnitrophota bacterium]MBU2250908.1 small basic protein [Candidatus Omnitrophota bacterium]MBU2474106.1 small basic protein [Candidatus Omnitrophota bacterium]